MTILIVLGRLKQYGLSVHIEKCLFGVKHIDFLEYRISSSRSTPLLSKGEAIKTFPQLYNIKALQEYLGMINYYNRFIPNAASILQPLHQSLKERSQKQFMHWSDNMSLV